VLDQLRLHRVQEHLGVPLGQRLAALGDPGQLLARGEPVGGADRQPCLVPALEPGHPDHEELVQVGGEDGQELGPLEQRLAGVLGQGEHPCVEVQPGQLPVQVTVVRQVVAYLRGGGRGRRRRVRLGGGYGGAGRRAAGPDGARHDPSGETVVRLAVRARYVVPGRRGVLASRPVLARRRVLARCRVLGGGLGHGRRGDIGWRAALRGRRGPGPRRGAGSGRAGGAGGATAGRGLRGGARAVGPAVGLGGDLGLRGGIERGGGRGHRRSFGPRR